MELDDETREFLTVNTHRGLCRPRRLQFGVHSITGIFQREMDLRLSHIPRVQVPEDYIAIGGLTAGEHCENLIKVCVALREADLTVI